MNSGKIFDPYNLNRPEFDASLYMKKVIESCNLNPMIGREHNLRKEIYSLESEKSNLVYDNYKKFLLGSETLSKIKVNFSKMEDDMHKLSDTIGQIEHFSRITVNVLDRHKNHISGLLSKHDALKKLDTVFEFVPKLKSHIGKGQYDLAVEHYLAAKEFLFKYRRISSFTSIFKDTEILINNLINILKDKFKSHEATVEELSQSLKLLQKLDAPVLNLCKDFLKLAQTKTELMIFARIRNNESEIDTISLNCIGIYGSFIDNLLIVTQTYIYLFLNTLQEKHSINFENSHEALKCFVNEVTSNFFQELPVKTFITNDWIKAAEFVDGMDHLYQKSIDINKLVPGSNLMKIVTKIISESCHHRCNNIVQELMKSFSDVLICLLQNLSADGNSQWKSFDLSQLLKDLEQSLVVVVESLWIHLQSFIEPDALTKTDSFQNVFFKDCIIKDILFPFLHHVGILPLNLTMNTDSKYPPSEFPLILSNFYFTLQKTHVSTLLNYHNTDLIWVFEKLDLTNLDMVSRAQYKHTAAVLINQFVRIQTEVLSRMIRVSMQRNWMNTTEPRMVRSVIRRILEALTFINDHQVSQIYTDISTNRKAFLQPLKHRVTFDTKNLDSSNISFSIRNLFSERIDPFATPTFTRASIVNAIVILCLKNFQEFVRLITFSSFGLQQMQVDLHYLGLHLSRVVDEDIVVVLLDEILGNCVRRCVSPILMDVSIVEVICRDSSSGRQ